MGQQGGVATTAIAAVEGAGSKRVIVLSGWALDSTVWLAARALTDVSRFTYAYVDYPGYGVNRDAPLAQSVDDMARVALDAADELGWDSYAVVGHSMGGMTALRVATLAPDRVSEVVAVTPASAAGTPLDEESYAGFKGAWADPGAAIKGALSPNIADGDLARLVARNRATMSQEAWEQYLANWTSGSFLDELGVYEGPVTLLLGDSDLFITADYIAETQNRLKNVTVEQISGSGHYPMIENPAELVRLMEAALGA